LLDKYYLINETEPNRQETKLKIDESVINNILKKYRIRKSQLERAIELEGVLGHLDRLENISAALAIYRGPPCFCLSADRAAALLAIIELEAAQQASHEES
jgi:hypothetical protein